MLSLADETIELLIAGSRKAAAKPPRPLPAQAREVGDFGMVENAHLRSDGDRRMLSEEMDEEGRPAAPAPAHDDQIVDSHSHRRPDDRNQAFSSGSSRARIHQSVTGAGSTAAATTTIAFAPRPHFSARSPAARANARATMRPTRHAARERSAPAIPRSHQDRKRYFAPTANAKAPIVPRGPRKALAV